ncbi:MAG: N-acetylglucosamine-6-phosphate deacetylase [Thermomicrobiales bacterium]
MWVAGRLVESGESVRVTIDGARITCIEIVDRAPDIWIAPGLIDMQVNGYAGHDVNAPDVTAEDIDGLTRVMWQLGVTAYCPTIITNSEEQINRSLRAITEARLQDPLVARSIPCIHVEGPHISAEDGPRGAHPRTHVRPPDVREYGRWQEAAGGHIGLITLSPEYPEAMAYIRAVTADGVVAGIGHTGATADQIRAAVHAGARLSTHLGNGAHDQLRRHPNYLWEQLAEDRLIATFIFDGHHLPDSVMKTALRAKGVDRTILISDSVALTGLPRGVYERADGSRVELLPSGKLNLFGTPYLAGSTATLAVCVANAVRIAGASLAEAIRMASANPIRLLGLEGPHRRGTIRVGVPADLTLFRHDPATSEISPHVTIVGGEMVYRADAT